MFNKYKILKLIIKILKFPNNCIKTEKKKIKINKYIKKNVSVCFDKLLKIYLG